MQEQRSQILEDVRLAKQLLEGTGYEVRRIRETTDEDDNADEEKQEVLRKNSHFARSRERSNQNS